MKKHLSIFLTAAMITILFTACNGSALAPAPSSSTPEAKKTEITEGSVRKEKNAEAATDVEEARVEEVSVQDEKKSAAPTGFQLLSSTATDAEGRLIEKRTYYEGGSLACWICFNPATNDYFIVINDREYNDEGKWIGTKIYVVHDIADTEGINPDDYKIEKNLNFTEECKYDDNGFVVLQSDLNGNLLYKYTYNSQGQQILQENYREGRVFHTVEYTYNEQGVLVKSVGKNDIYETDIEYTPFGVTSLETLRQEKSIKTGDISLTNTKELHYDDKGILTDGECIVYGEVTETYTFVLDEYGNILHYSIFDKEGDLVRNVEKEIVPVYD